MAPEPNDSQRVPLDELDRRILDAVTADGRITNAALAERVGVAPSTAHTRLRGLIDRGVISSFTASVAQARLGVALQALVGVTLRPGARQASITDFAEHTRSLAEVVQVFFLGFGEADVHIGRILAEATGAEYQGSTDDDLAAVIEELSGYF